MVESFCQFVRVIRHEFLQCATTFLDNVAAEFDLCPQDTQLIIVGFFAFVAGAFIGTVRSARTEEPVAVRRVCVGEDVGNRVKIVIEYHDKNNKM